jgi:oligopeptidase B
MPPPKPTPIPNVKIIHNDKFVDHFSWIENINHPNTLPYLKAENRYAEQSTEHLHDLRKTLLKELMDRTPTKDSTAPYKIKDWSRFATIDKDQSYWVHKRKDQSNRVEILLDENKRAESHAHYQLDALQLSPSQNKMAWLEDTHGHERFRLCIKDLQTQEVIHIPHPNIKWSLAWLDDHRLVYVVGDNADRPCSIHLYNCDTTRENVLWTDDDEHFYLSVHRARSGDFVICESHSKTTSEIRLLSLKDNTCVLTTVEPRQHGIKYTVEVGHDSIFIRSNKNRREFEVYQQKPHKGSSTPLFYRPDDDSTIESIDLFKDFLVCWIRRNGLQQVLILNNETRHQQTVPFPDPTYEIYADVNPHFGASTFRLRYTSPIQPDIVLQYDISSDTQTCIHRFNTPNYTPAEFRCERLWATSTDGTQVPISIVESIDAPSPSDTTSPVLMVGYGAYGVSYNAGFYSPWISLMKRGFRIAIAHVRGGGELGRQWYNQGKGRHKQNGFDDFIACAEYLISHGYTTSETLVISGGSAGGLLVAASLNQRPELFGGCVAEVPFVDVTNTMLNPLLPLTVIEYEEWGNPNHPTEYNTISQYDPYRQYTGQYYPPMLVTAGLHDPRVGYWEPTKWIAKIRTLHPDSSNILLKINMSSGHSGASGRLDMLQEDAWHNAFIVNCIRTSRQSI